MTDLHALIHRMADELDHYRQLLTDDRRELHPLATEARAALAESDGPAVPEGREPAAVVGELSDEELKEAYWEAYRDATMCGAEASWLAGLRAVAGLGRDKGAAALAAAILSHPGALEVFAQPRPVPVAERLPGPEDCDAEGRCWWWYSPVPEQTYGYWAHEDDATDRSYEEWPSAWLPAHALPLPTTEPQP